MDREVSPKTGQLSHDNDELKLDRLSALLTLATDSNPSINRSAIDELCRLDATCIQLLATDLLTLTEAQIDQASREKIFQALVPHHQTLPPLSSALVLELLGDERQQDFTLERLRLLNDSSLGALPVLVYLARMLSESESVRSGLFIECARDISYLANQFISQFAPELPHQIRSKVQLPHELEICGRLLFTDDHNVFFEPMSDLLESTSLNEVTFAPSSILLLLGGDLEQMPMQTQMAAL
jgi:hypothetical protein